MEWRWSGGGVEVEWMWSGGGAEVGRLAESQSGPDEYPMHELIKKMQMTRSRPASFVPAPSLLFSSSSSPLPPASSSSSSS